MAPLEISGLVSLIGLLVQCAMAWIFAGFLAVLGRSSGRPAWFRDWTVSFVALAVALTAMAVRYTWPHVISGPLFRVESSLAPRATYALYACGKALHVAFLCSGTLLFTHEGLSRRARRGLLAASLLLAVGLTLPSGDIAVFMSLQSPVMVVGFALTCVLLLRLPPQRRNVGTRTAALALGATAVVWGLYTIAFLRPDATPWPLSKSFWTALITLNSYVDMALMTLLATGLSATLLTDALRRLREVQRERAQLSATLQRDEKLRALGTLVSGVAHELNNPLAAILAGAEELHSGEREPARRARLDDLMGQVRRSADIVRSLTALRRGLVGDFVPTQAGAIARAAAEACAPHAEARGVQLDVQLDVELVGGAELEADVSSLERALGALIDNALQASPRGVRVLVRASCNDEQVIFSVEDGGAGVPAELRERIFEPFFSTRFEQGAQGLGLSLAHSAARAHGGDLILATRAEGQLGTRMELVVPRGGPRSEPEPLQPRARPAPRAEGRELCVLVIDDEPLLRDMLASFGRRHGWRVELAEDGLRALELLEQAELEPDCVICDLRMPGLSGADVYARVQQFAPGLAARFVFLSGDVTSPEAEFVRSEIGRPVLAKPLPFATLRALVEELAGRTAAVGSP